MSDSKLKANPAKGPAENKKRSKRRQEGKLTNSVLRDTVSVLDEGLYACIKDFACLHVKEEKKVTRSVKPTLHLLPDPSPNGLIPSRESLLMTKTIRGLFGDKTYAFRLSTVLFMNSTGSGNVNSIIGVATIGGLSEFSSLTTLFNEVFVSKMTVRWEPVSRYNGPVGFVNTTSVASLPIMVADLQHGAVVYGTIADAANNFRRSYQNTGVPFTFVWKNTESSKERILPNPDSTTSPTQSWCQTNNVGNYTGSLQFISNTAVAMPPSANLGNFVVDWDLLFRVRQ